MEQEQPLLLQLDQLDLRLDPKEEEALRNMLSHPLFRRYLLAQFNTAANDFLTNEAETPEQEKKLLARFQKLKGVQYMCTYILNNFQERKTA